MLSKFQILGSNHFRLTTRRQSQKLVLPKDVDYIDAHGNIQLTKTGHKYIKSSQKIPDTKVQVLNSRFNKMGICQPKSSNTPNSLPYASKIRQSSVNFITIISLVSRPSHNSIRSQNLNPSRIQAHHMTNRIPPNNTA